MGPATPATVEPVVEEVELTKLEQAKETYDAFFAAAQESSITRKERRVRTRKRKSAHRARMANKR